MRRALENPWLRAALALGGALALGAFVYQTRAILAPFFLAFIIAYVLDPVVDRLERLRVPFTAYHLPRALGVSLVFLGAVAASAIVILLVLPTIIHQVSDLADRMARYRATELPLLIPRLEKALGVQLPRSSQQLFDQLVANTETLKDLSNRLMQPAGHLLQRTVTSIVDAFLGALTLVMAPILTFYLLKDIDKIRVAAAGFVPYRYRPWLFSRLRAVDLILSTFIRGQMTVCLVLGTLYSSGLAILGLPLWLVVGFLSGFGNVVPYLGTIIGLSLSLLLMLLEHPDAYHLAGVLLVFAVVQGLEGTVVTPKIVGDTLGLHPVVVMLAVLMGGELFGFVGVLLAVPATAAGSVFWRDLVARYRASVFFGREQEAPPEAPPPAAPGAAAATIEREQLT
ncbi:MAG: AI-2E family transporter [Candidatus Schekmanbacteria bacterium]|nr:AI-2E family transporter [Candidatus Schekmanbacteria bacterium]